jgi:polypeptide N-acetylgalactosaminyltransferase
MLAQAWMYTKAHEIRHSDDICLDSWASQLPGAVHMEKCHQMHGNQEWLYDEEQKTVKHKGVPLWFCACV